MIVRFDSEIQNRNKMETHKKGVGISSILKEGAVCTPIDK